MLVDANVLLFAVDSSSPFHPEARAWLDDKLNGPRRVGLPWQSLTAFLRMSTNARASEHPLAPAEAWGYVREWLEAEAAWVPEPTERHREVLGALIVEYDLRGHLISDAELATLAIEHGLTVISADTDFARFTEVRWENPVASRPKPRRLRR